MKRLLLALAVMSGLPAAAQAAVTPELSNAIEDQTLDTGNILLNTGTASRVTDAEAQICSIYFTTMAECTEHRSDSLKTSNCNLTACTYKESYGYQWCRGSCDTSASAGGTSSGGTSDETNCAYKTRSECLAVKSHGSCAADLSSGCFYPTACAIGYYKNTELTIQMIGVTDPVPTCAECPANATCDGTSVFCNSGYLLTSINPDSSKSLIGQKWCILAKSGDDIIDDVKKPGITDAVASIDGSCPDGLSKSSDGCCCTK